MRPADSRKKYSLCGPFRNPETLQNFKFKFYANIFTVAHRRLAYVDFAYLLSLAAVQLASPMEAAKQIIIDRLLFILSDKNGV